MTEKENQSQNEDLPPVSLDEILAIDGQSIHVGRVSWKGRPTDEIK
jgi:hypothetical protein